jgi:ketosteroid isomerase-like protein
VPARESEAMLRRMYAAFDARDVEAIVGAMHPDVDWPNAWEGGRLRGRADVLAYWRRQFEAIDPRVTPEGFAERPDGRIAVDVHQVVRSLDGELLADRRVVHVYALRDGLVARMDVEDG